MLDFSLIDNTTYSKTDVGLLDEITAKDLNKGRNSLIFLKKHNHSFNEKIIKKVNDDKFITKNYIGCFHFNGKNYEIKSRYGDELLNEMLKKSNNILFNNFGFDYAKNDSINLEKIIYIYFIKYLKLAKLNGYPKNFVKTTNRDFCIKGSFDFSQYIQKDIIKKTKISSKCSKLECDSLMISVLLKAYNLVITKYPDLQNIDKSLKSFLSNKSLKKPISIYDIFKVKNSKILSNPLYKNYKKALELAINIIYKEHICTYNKQSNLTINLNFGFLIYIPELFEDYIESLLRDKKYKVENQVNLKLFNGTSIRPDFVIKKDDKILILDAKYRSFNTDKKSDINNIHQISSYGYNYSYKNKIEIDKISLALIYADLENCNEIIQNSYISILSLLKKDQNGIYAIDKNNFLDNIEKLLN